LKSISLIVAISIDVAMDEAKKSARAGWRVTKIAGLARIVWSVLARGRAFEVGKINQAAPQPT
jgi:hypothetical protein